MNNEKDTFDDLKNRSENDWVLEWAIYVIPATILFNIPGFIISSIIHYKYSNYKRWMMYLATKDKE